jgi:hypothetical protein
MGHGDSGRFPYREKYLAGMISREEVVTKAQDPVTTQAKLRELESAQAERLEAA